MGGLSTFESVRLTWTFRTASANCDSGLSSRYFPTAPFLLSPLAGWLVDVIGFGYVFSSTVVVILLSGMLTFRLDEPRHCLAEEVQPVDVATPE